MNHLPILTAVLLLCGHAHAESASPPHILLILGDDHGYGDLPPGREVVKFSPYLNAIRELAIDGIVSIELEYSPDPSRIVERVEEAYCETDRIMRLCDFRG